MMTVVLAVVDFGGVSWSFIAARGASKLVRLRIMRIIMHLRLEKRVRTIESDV